MNWCVQKRRAQGRDNEAIQPDYRSCFAQGPRPLSNTPELSGSHVAVMAPMSSAVECHGTYKLTGPATLIKATSADSLEAYLGQGAKLELYTGDGIITMTHAVSAAGIGP